MKQVASWALCLAASSVVLRLPVVVKVIELERCLRLHLLGEELLLLRILTHCDLERSIVGNCVSCSCSSCQ